jgi:arylsulfatase A-like enzyme
MDSSIVRMKNVLLIVVDCLRSGELLGPQRTSRTPNMDNLLAQAAVFPNAITAANYTRASVVSLLTGLYPAAHGVTSLYAYRLASGAATLASHLRARGYHTAAFVTGPLTSDTGVGEGFDQYEYRGPECVVFGEWGKQFAAKVVPQMPEPWFVFVHLWELHLPRSVAPECDGRPFGRTDYERALSSIDFFVGSVMESVRRDDCVIVLTSDHGEVLPSGGASVVRGMAKQAVERLGGMRKRVVRLLVSARVPRKIRRLGVYGHVHSLSEEVIRVPLVIAGFPGVVRKTVFRELVRTIDVMPTVLQITGVPLGRGTACQGEDLTGLVAGGAWSRLEPAVVESGVHGSVGAETRRLLAVRTRGWKLVFAADNPRFPVELYDLMSADREGRNVAGRYPERVEEMRQAGLAVVDESARVRLSAEKLSHEEQVIVRERLRALGYMV